MFRYLTAGESHGKGLVGVIEGFPSNVKIDLDKINHDLGRRHHGFYGNLRNFFRGKG